MLRRRLRSRHSVACLVLAVPVALAGTAYLASNVVPVTHAGVSQVTVSISTTLTFVDPDEKAKVDVAQSGKELDSYHFINVAAQLSAADDSPVAGETITFTTDTSKASAGVICQDTTDADGIARCPNDTKIPTSEFSGTPTKFVATFAGDGALAASTVSGDLRLLAADS